FAPARVTTDSTKPCCTAESGPTLVPSAPKPRSHADQTLGAETLQLSRHPLHCDRGQALLCFPKQPRLHLGVKLQSAVSRPRQPSVCVAAVRLSPPALEPHLLGAIVPQWRSSACEAARLAPAISPARL